MPSARSAQLTSPGIERHVFVDVSLRFNCSRPKPLQCGKTEDTPGARAMASACGTGGADNIRPECARGPSKYRRFDRHAHNAPPCCLAVTSPIPSRPKDNEGIHVV